MHRSAMDLHHPTSSEEDESRKNADDWFAKGDVMSKASENIRRRLLPNDETGQKERIRSLSTSILPDVDTQVIVIINGQASVPHRPL